MASNTLAVVSGRLKIRKATGVVSWKLAINKFTVRDLRKNKMPARRAEPSHPIWAKFQNVARKVAIVLVL
jgi:hypothetical protein